MASYSFSPDDQEEDIGDLSPYSFHNSSSSSTIDSFNGDSPRVDNSGDEEESEPVETPTRMTFATQILSPSLSRRTDTVLPIARAHTLPVDIGSPSAVPKLEIDAVHVVRMRRWMMGIAIVDFDLDSGPIVEGIYPPLSLTPAELQNIAFCAFPDSMQFDQGSQTHSFRTRGHSPDGFVYGFSHFVQKRDPTSKRGYSQRSIVLLTQFQYPALYSSLVDIFGPLFARHGLPMLEAACYNIATWPDPTPGKTIELGFLGSVLHVELPHSLDVQQVTATASFNEKYDPRSHILAATAPFNPPPILLFEASLSHLWSIWECLVLCEPILVFGASPAQTSQAVWWLRDLLRPIPLAGDIRPYFTMQDADHMELVNKRQPKAGVILGVTNPFFEKSCAHWPHVLSLGRKTMPTASPRSPLLGAPAGPSPGWTTRTHKRYISKDRTLLKQMETAMKRDDAARMEASLALRRHFCNRSAQLIAPLARYLNSLIPSPAEVHRARKTAIRYTPSLLATPSFVPSSKSTSTLASSSSSASSFATKHNTTMLSTSPQLSGTPNPSHATLSSPRIPPPGSAHAGLRLRPFNNANFFASLKANGSVLPFKSTAKRTEFYERWLRSPAFGTWLTQQAHIMEDMLNESVSAGTDSSYLGHS